jgi:hypothetical protein
LPDQLSDEPGQTANYGGAEFFHRFAHDDADDRPEVFAAFRAGAAYGSSASDYEVPQIAGMGPVKIADVAAHDPELAGMGSSVGDSSICDSSTQREWFRTGTFTER